MFLDESGDHSLEKIDASYPMFVLVGCIFDFDYYNTTAESEIHGLKQKHFGRTDIILRSYDIRKQKGNFACLVDKEKRLSFYSDLDDTMTTLKYTLIAATINKLAFKRQYRSPDNPYHLCFRFVLERAMMFIGSKKETMMFRIESRETHNDKELADVYDNFRQGNKWFAKSEIQAKLLDLSFNQKSQNVAGMQIADLAAYPIGRKVLNPQRDNLAFDIIKPKIYSKSGNDYGLKTFP
ncbi:MAG: DUF3800 domain-containing protein [Elusimicrobiales bacterium]